MKGASEMEKMNENHDFSGLEAFLGYPLSPEERRALELSEKGGREA